MGRNNKLILLIRDGLDVLVRRKIACTAEIRTPRSAFHSLVAIPITLSLLQKLRDNVQLPSSAIHAHGYIGPDFILYTFFTFIVTLLRGRPAELAETMVTTYPLSSKVNWSRILVNILAIMNNNIPDLNR